MRTPPALRHLLACIGLLSGAAAQAHACSVIRVVDGDTLYIRCGEQQIRARISAIDAPEKNQAFGQRARQALSDLCLEKPATLRTVASDRYGKTMAEVQCEGKDVGAEMVREGMAWVSDSYAKDYPRLSPLQLAAHQHHLGLWVARDPQPPWEFRKKPAPQAACGPEPAGAGHKPQGC